MPAAIDDTTPPALEPTPPPVQVPEGYWIREAGHAPLPWTTFTRAIAWPRLHSEIGRMYAEFGIPFDTVEYAAIGGWDYIRLVPLVASRRRGCPPAWSR